ncbi:DUF4118 domain-containing protein [Streptomyces sp. NPDC046685]|uniref:DUF4118 domain-containing protein n=1 Tax=Streptomyces sp. NPDC046685 TaxID=3157202 RepID=UPI003410BAEB
MVVWKRMSSGIRPVPRPAPTPSVWAVAATMALILVTAFNLHDGQGDPTLDLVALSLAVALVSTGARLTAAPGTAFLCWLVLNGFATAPIGQLTWEAPYDLTRFGCLLAAACVGTVTARLSNARAAHHRLRA